MEEFGWSEKGIKSFGPKVSAKHGFDLEEDLNDIVVVFNEGNKVSSKAIGEERNQVVKRSGEREDNFLLKDNSQRKGPVLRSKSKKSCKSSTIRRGRGKDQSSSNES